MASNQIYGEAYYECKKCRKEWIKYDTKDDQPCLRCKRLVKCYQFHPKTKRMFGEYECKRCNNRWSSGNAWIRDGEKMGQQCRKCKRMLLPCVLRPLNPSASDDGVGKPHEQELCEMCQILGRNCRDVESDNEYTESSEDEDLVQAMRGLKF